MHLQAAMSNGWRVEFHFEMWGVGDKIYKEPPAPDQGWVTLPETPGLGLKPRWDALKEFEEKYRSVIMTL
jgi:L-alanine-DL-glutamate epimerase-like enolase superfamily enzyme